MGDVTAAVIIKVRILTAGALRFSKIFNFFWG